MPMTRRGGVECEANKAEVLGPPRRHDLSEGPSTVFPRSCHFWTFAKGKHFNCSGRSLLTLSPGISPSHWSVSERLGAFWDLGFGIWDSYIRTGYGGICLRGSRSFLCVVTWLQAARGRRGTLVPPLSWLTWCLGTKHRGQRKYYNRNRRHVGNRREIRFEVRGARS